MAKTRRTTAKKLSIQGQSVKASLEYVIPDNFPSRFATHMIAQVSDNQCYLSFFEAKPPIVLTDGAAKDIKVVRANCVSQVIIGTETLRKVVAVLQELSDKIPQHASLDSSDNQG